MRNQGTGYNDVSASGPAPATGLLWNLVRSGRPASSLLAGALAALTVWHSPSARWSAVLLAGLSFTTLTMSGFVLNDVFDIEKDKLAHVRRPIAMGKVGLALAKRYAAALFFISATGAWLGSRSVPALSLIGFAIPALYAYSPFARRWPLFKGAYTAALCCLPFLYGVIVIGAYPKWYACPLLFLCVCGRELYMDAVESEGDLRSGLKTLASTLGRIQAMRLGTLTMLSGLTLIVLLSLPAFSSLPAILGLVVLIYVLQTPRLSEEQRVNVSRIVMLLASATVASFAR